LAVDLVAVGDQDVVAVGVVAGRESLREQGAVRVGNIGNVGVQRGAIGRDVAPVDRAAQRDVGDT
jgi:hypothetical protein